MRAEEQKQIAENLSVGNSDDVLLRSYDWLQTPLGAIETWSADLKTAVQYRLIELNSAQTELGQPESMPSQNGNPITLRQTARADAFRIGLSDALRLLTDANEIQATAARMLGEFLGASRVIYVEVLPSGDEVIVHKNYTNGVAELSGRYRLEAFGRNLIEDHRSGRSVIVPDVANSFRYTESEKAMYRTINIAAHLDVPMIKNDQVVALLAFHQTMPREWTELEVQQVEEAAEQTWAAIERACVEAALRESEAKYRTLFESIDEGFCTVEVLLDPDGKPVDHRILQANPAFERQSGIAKPEGKTASELAPGLEQYWNDLYAQVIHTGQSIRIEQRSDALDRWFDVLVSRVGDSATRRVAIVFTDISDRKRAEAILQQASDELERQVRKFDAIAASVPDFIYTFDSSGRFTYISQSLLDLWQKSSAEAVGKNFFELDYPGDLAARLQNQIQRVIETRQPLKDETPYTSAFGTSTYEYIFVPLFDATGTVEAVTGVTRDITDRKRAEAILQQTSDELERQVRKFDATLSTITDSVFTFDRERRFLYANQVLLDLWGVSAAEAIGKTMADLDYPLSVERQVLDDLQRVFETGETVKNETPYTNPAGVEGYFEYILSPVFAADHTVESVVGSSRNISDHKRAEAALRESEQRFRLMADAVPQIVWITDADGRVEFFNKQWSNYTGVPYEPTTAAAVATHFVHPDDGALTMEAFDQARRSGSVFSVEHRICSAAGTYRWFLVRAEPYRDPQTGEIVRWFGASIDIHDRKQAEAALRQSEEQSRNILESITDAFFSVDQNWQFAYANQTAYALTGYIPGKLIGKNFWEAFPELADSEFEQMHRRVMRDRVA